MIDMESCLLFRGKYSLLYNKYLLNPSEEDFKIVENRLELWNEDQEPRVGDFIKMSNKSYERFAYKWPDGMQTTNGGSFYLGDGYASMSGALNPTIPFDKIKRTDEMKEGFFWIFHNDIWQEGYGIDVLAPCRVYRFENKAS